MSDALLPPLSHLDFPLQELTTALRGEGSLPDFAHASPDGRCWAQVAQVIVSLGTHHDPARRRFDAVECLAPHLTSHQALELLQRLVNHRSLIESFPWAAWASPLIARVPRGAKDLDEYQISESVMGLLHRQAPLRVLRALVSRRDWSVSPQDTYDLGREAFIAGHLPRLHAVMASALEQVNAHPDTSLLAVVLQDTYRAQREALVQASPQVAISLVSTASRAQRDHHLLQALLQTQPDQAAFLHDHGAGPLSLPVDAYLRSTEAKKNKHTLETVDRSVCMALYNHVWPASLQPWLAQAAWPLRKRLPEFHQVQSALNRQQLLQRELQATTASAGARRRPRA